MAGAHMHAMRHAASTSMARAQSANTAVQPPTDFHMLARGLGGRRAALHRFFLRGPSRALRPAGATPAPHRERVCITGFIGDEPEKHKDHKILSALGY